MQAPYAVFVTVSMAAAGRRSTKSLPRTFTSPQGGTCDNRSLSSYNVFVRRNHLVKRGVKYRVACYYADILHW